MELKSIRKYRPLKRFQSNSQVGNGSVFFHINFCPCIMSPNFSNHTARANISYITLHREREKESDEEVGWVRVCSFVYRLAARSLW